MYDLLSPIRPPRRVVKSLLKNFGSNAPQFVTENPYRLLDYPGMGWDRVDRFALNILKYDKNGIERHKRAILEVLSREAERGNTKTDYPTLFVESSNMLGVQLLNEAIERLEYEKMVIVRDKFISPYEFYNAEVRIAEEVQRIQETGGKLEFNLGDEGLDEEQKNIPHMIENNPVSILSGIPGSGKSHSVSVIVKSLYDNNLTSILILVRNWEGSKA